jgi:hypothetical protein
MKIIFESEYEKHTFEKLLNNIYEDSTPGSKGINVTENLADSLASLYAKVAKADTGIENSDCLESVTTTTALSLPMLTYFGKNSDV